ncbi:MAG: hypothetical protein ACTHLW_21535 [Verrucomicrobiota bacterium]
MLDRDDCAAWLKVKRRYLDDDAMLDTPKIPVFRPSPKVVRYHPRTILAKLAKDAGVSFEVIAASYGVNEQPKGEQQ